MQEYTLENTFPRQLKPGLLRQLRGQLPQPVCKAEKVYQDVTIGLLLVAIALIALLPFPICFDIIGRTWFGYALDGVVEMETLALVIIAFSAMPFIAATATNITIDLLLEKTREANRTRLKLFSCLVCASITGLLAVFALTAGWENNTRTASLRLQESWFVLYTALGLGLICLGLVFRAADAFDSMWKNGDKAGILACFAAALLIVSLPLLYKGLDASLSRLAVGGLGFLLLFAMMLLGVPIGLAMCLIGVLGLFCISRSPQAVWSMVAQVPYRETANFVLVAAPMFMLMGELTSVSNISRDLFDCANKWLGHSLPGGLACSTVAGCAGFGAICGDSLATVITMSSVALPPMLENNYAPRLACGALASGGTLAILIPPSMGFIFYSIMTEESVGKLFIAGIIPGLILAAIFIGIIIFLVKRDPALAPPSPAFSLGEKLRSLAGLIPMALIFLLVIGGILEGVFTPGEGGAVGAMGAFLYGLARRQLSLNGLRHSLLSTALMTGRIFVILVGVYVLGSFLSASRLPNMLANLIIEMDANKYLILAVITVMYLILGCLMNILPMMLLTLPSIYPTVQALGFDGIWFGVYTVILMECGMITPPVGMNVFTLASLTPEIPMSTIFKGVMPFFCGMLICAFIIVVFPSLATWLPSRLM